MNRARLPFLRRAKVKSVLYYLCKNVNPNRHPHRWFRSISNLESYRCYSSTHPHPDTHESLKQKQMILRNVGIMAHIDAGKTTTTERMLYLSGVIHSPGEVHHGDTVTDYLPQERERGITIQSAVVNFEWNDCSINLIDTPGHVDFTFEVERSLRVVDSAVAILDASAGVEAQTLTVWRQATENSLPRLIFLNKMDKVSASLAMCLDSIKSKLKSTPLLLQLPVYQQNKSGSGSGLIGLVDLVSLQRYEYDASSKGAKYSVRDVSSDRTLVMKRCELIDQLTDLDNSLAELVIEKDSVEAVQETDIHSAIKRIILNNEAVPVLLGSSYKHVGVQPLMNAIVSYFPYPMESGTKDPVVESYCTELCSFAFKTIHDRQLGPLTFVRLFAGTLLPGQKVYNVTQNKTEKLGKIYLPLADDFKEIPQLSFGQVAVVSGLKETVTGDTLTSTSAAASTAGKKLTKIKAKLTTDSQGDKGMHVRPVLLGVSVPEPVFFCSIEASSLSHQKGLDEALACLQREDPSLHVSIDTDTAQTVLSGMGELHLEIIQERIKSDFKVDAYLGKLMVAYKETIVSPITRRLRFERKLGDPPKQSITIELELHPEENPSQILKKGRGKEVQEHLSTALNEKQFRLIQNGIESALRYGPKLGFPVLKIQALINYFEITRGTSDAVIEVGAANCIRECLQLGSVTLLEPIVSLEVTVDENYQPSVMDDLNRRKFILQSINQKHGNKVISGHAALSEMMGYSTSLRTVSSGMGTFSMQFSHYNRVSNAIDEAKIVQSVRGF